MSGEENKETLPSCKMERHSESDDVEIMPSAWASRAVMQNFCTRSQSWAGTSSYSYGNHPVLPQGADRPDLYSGTYNGFCGEGTILYRNFEIKQEVYIFIKA